MFAAERIFLDFLDSHHFAYQRIKHLAVTACQKMVKLDVLAGQLGVVDTASESSWIGKVVEIRSSLVSVQIAAKRLL